MARDLLACDPLSLMVFLWFVLVMFAFPLPCSQVLLPSGYDLVQTMHSFLIVLAEVGSIGPANILLQNLTIFQNSGVIEHPETLKAIEMTNYAVWTQDYKY